MDKKELISNLKLGSRVAEDERNELVKYFINTNQCKEFLDGDIDIVFGLKGSGKSALYIHLLNKTNAYLTKNIYLIPAENVSGDVVFREIQNDPPTSEAKFIFLWKLYLISIVGNYLENDDKFQSGIIDILKKENLIDKSFSLKDIFSRVAGYIKKYREIDSFEVTTKFDQFTGLFTGFSKKITFRPTTSSEEKKGYRSIDSLFKILDSDLKTNHKNIWIALDRLDVAFVDADIEENALRALFRVYLDLQEYENISLKLFLRTDIWNNITNKGFREASHITRSTNIQWGNEELLDLIVRRFYQNDSIRQFLKIDKDYDKLSYKEKEKIFYRIFPDRIELGTNKPTTFNWILSRVKDGLGVIAPREIVHLINSIKDAEIRRLELDFKSNKEQSLFDRSSFVKGLDVVSATKLNQTIYAEYPKFKCYIDLLKNQHSEHTINSLSQIWKTSKNKTKIISEELHKIGIFEKRGTRESPKYWIPFIYRPVLNSIQGSHRKI
ncbi:MAG: hypothetical protein KA015_05260 [Spirochaetes bacterium]|nr:hypothetical protein [Spirochaetota bacterium]